MQKLTGASFKWILAGWVLTLLAVLCIGTNVTAVSAETTQIHYPYGSLSYTFTGSSDGTGFVANVEGYQREAIVKGSLEIPAEITYNYTDENGEQKSATVPVTGILSGAFSGSTSLETLTLPYTINYIGQEAFSNCTNLNRITTLDANGTKLGDIVAAQEIEYRAFSGCTALAGLTLDSVAGNSVRRVASEAFFNCTGLKSFTVGPDVTDIGAGFLAGCISLNGGQQSIKVIDNNHFFVYDGILYQRMNNTNNVLVQCPTGKVVTTETPLAEYVTQIKDEAFYGCKNLYSIDIPKTTVSIGSKSFYGCTSLGNVTIPSSVVSIGAQAFYGCGSGLCFTCVSGSAADNYAISNGITRNTTCTVTFHNTYTGVTVTKTTQNGGTVDPPMGWDREGYILRWSGSFDATTIINTSRTVYTEWKRLYTVTFKDTVTGLESVVSGIEEGTAASAPAWTRKGYKLSWSSESYKNVRADMTVYAVWLISMTDTEVKEPDYRVGSIAVVDNVRYKVTDTLHRYVHAVGLNNRAVKTVNIPDRVTFGGKTYSVRAIASNAFKSNRSIVRVYIGKYVKVIGRNAFYGCTSLRRVNIYSLGITTIAGGSFKGTSSALRVYAMTTRLASRYRIKLLDAGISLKARVVKLK